MNARPRLARPLAAAVPVLAALLAFAPDAFARAGGGSNSGGGGGGILTLIILPFVGAYVWWKNKKIKDKNRAAEELLDRLSRTDPAWEERRLLEESSRLFIAVERAWCDQDLPGLRNLLAPELFPKWESQISDLAAKGWRNRLDRLTLGQVRVVEVQNFKGTERDTFTVCVEAAAEDYTTDQSGAIVESNTSDDDARRDRRKVFETFREFWTFLRRGDGWVLQRVDEDGDWARTVQAPLVDEGD